MQRVSATTDQLKHQRTVISEKLGQPQGRDGEKKTDRSVSESSSSVLCSVKPLKIDTFVCFFFCFVCHTSLLRFTLQQVRVLKRESKEMRNQTAHLLGV